MSKEKWYIGQASRQKADDLLNSSGINGSFVIRASATINGAYALSVLFNKAIHTYRILPTENGKLAVQTLRGVQERKFNSLDEMVREYHDPQNGLVCGLTNPIGETGPLPPEPLPRTGPLPALPMDHLQTGETAFVPNQPCDFKIVDNREKLRVLHVPPPPSSQLSDPLSPDCKIKDRLLSRIGDIKTAWCGTNEVFMESIQHYLVDGGLKSDINNVSKGGEHCAQLQTLLAREALSFQSELEIFLTKVDMLRQLFDSSMQPRKSLSCNRILNPDVDLDTFLVRLRDCQTVVKALNKRACLNLQSSLGIPAVSVPKPSTRKPSKICEPITERIFEVKQEGALKLSKQKLKMNIVDGKFTIIKGDDSATYPHRKVLQLIKSNKAKSKLGIVIDGLKKKEFTFEKSSEREAFCQLMQYLRNKSNSSTDPDCISLFVGTWNMGDAMPPVDINSWFMCNGSGKCLDQGMQNVPHDVYVIGTQESIMPERDWMHKITETLQTITGVTFHLVSMNALWHMKIIVLVKEEHKNRISHVQTSTVKTGIANALGNKGAVAVSFQFGCTSFCFINSHLAARAENCQKRNHNYHDIIRSLNLGEDRFSIFDLTNRFDHLFFFGDLNYRLEMEVVDILKLIENKDLASLYENDQLRREKKYNKVLSGFNEDELLFPPTYRYDRGNRETYSYLKVKKTGVRTNAPSWCDRVLWRSYPEMHSVCQSYGCTDDITTSDHSPVFASFEIGVRSQYVSSEGISSSSNDVQGVISFNSIDIILYTNNKACFYLQFHSNCLTKFEKSSRNPNRCTESNYVKLSWTASCLPQLKPIISDHAFLIDQHLLICIRSEDDNEVVGECVVALRSMIGTLAQKFEKTLTKKGEVIGRIIGRVSVKARESKKAVKEKTYEFIQIRKDEDRDSIPEISNCFGVDENLAHGIGTPMQPANLNQPRNIPVKPNNPSSEFTSTIGALNDNIIPKTKNFSHCPLQGSTSSPIQNSMNSRSGTSQLPFIRSNVHTNVISDFHKGNSSLLHRPNSPVLFRTSTPGLSRRVLNQRPSSTCLDLSDSWNPDQQSSKSSVGNFSSHGNSVADMPSRLPPSPNPTKQRNSSNDYPHEKVSSSQFPFRPPKNASSDHYLNTLSSPLRGKSLQNGENAFPSSVKEFLSMINLEHYADHLQSKGWDSIEFLGELTEDDLVETGITDLEHCQIILEKIRSLSL